VKIDEKSGESAQSDLQSRILRARSLPSRKPFDGAVGLAMLHYFGIIATLTAVIACFKQPSLLASQVAVGGIVFSALSWLLAYMKRRATFCPLCKGTPLANSGALTHRKALRLGPFNHGTTAIFSIIARQKFRCMYCGSDFDLLKKPSYLTANSTEP
jgi:hypothetical protein